MPARVGARAGSMGPWVHGLGCGPGRPTLQPGLLSIGVDLPAVPAAAARPPPPCRLLVARCVDAVTRSVAATLPPHPPMSPRPCRPCNSSPYRTPRPPAQAALRDPLLFCSESALDAHPRRHPAVRAVLRHELHSMMRTGGALSAARHGAAVDGTSQLVAAALCRLSPAALRAMGLAGLPDGGEGEGKGRGGDGGDNVRHCEDAARWVMGHRCDRPPCRVLLLTYPLQPRPLRPLWLSLPRDLFL